MTEQRRQILRIEMTELDGYKSFEVYDNFQIGNENAKFELKYLGSLTADGGWHATDAVLWVPAIKHFVPDHIGISRHL